MGFYFLGEALEVFSVEVLRFKNLFGHRGLEAGSDGTIEIISSQGLSDDVQDFFFKFELLDVVVAHVDFEPLLAGDDESDTCDVAIKRYFD